ncbi:ABC transporter substrate-binding protein [Aminobacter anthyllidis]|uniref:ABC transporter substrate-binding protein n=1 Tax=Aminobacter anthyllidis TaxID=1035067 RepID=UPI002458A05C|nr:ABC transporter substrate-binding protein [Aminobacter anthyllidis]MDH4984184.1 ABC transporter substrate-binding protein [Aminobacter anthyllidis]
MSTKRLMAALLATSMLVAGVVAGSAQDKTTKIALLAPVSGKAAADGAEMVNGARMAVDEINAAGGVAGYKLELVVGDIQDSTPDVVTSVFERLAGDRDVNAMVSGYTSTTNFEIELMAEQEMPYIIAGNTAETRAIIAAAPDKYPTVWSYMPTYDAYESELVSVVDGLEKSGKLPAGNKKAALISSDNPYSKTIMDGLKKNFEAAGWTVTSTDLLPFGEINDWRPFLAKVREAKPAVIVNTDYISANAATFLTQFLEQPTKSLVFIQYAPSVPEFMELTKDKSTGIMYNMIGGLYGTNGDNKRATEVVSKYKAKYGAEPGGYGAHLYEQVYIYADALAKVGDPTDRLAIGKAIGETDKQVSIGRIAFDPKTHLALQGADAVPILFFQLWNGERKLVYPANLAGAEFQTPPWMK